MRNIRKERRKVLLLPISIVAISTAAIFIRFAQRTIPSTVIAAYRLLLASLFLLPFTIRKAIKELNELPLRSHLLLLLSGFLLALHFASWIISLELTNVLSSVVLVTTTPIWVSAISPLFFKAKISRKFWIGLMVAFIGLLVVSDIGVIDSEMISFQSDLSGSLPEKLIGNGLALLGSFCAAGYVIIGRKQRQDLTTGTYAFIVYSFAAILLLCYSVFIAKESLFVDLRDLKWLVLLALIPQLIGHSLINWFLGFLPAHKVSISLLGEPIGSTLLAIIVLREIPMTREIIGAVIILAGILVAIAGKAEVELKGQAKG